MHTYQIWEKRRGERSVVLMTVTGYASAKKQRARFMQQDARYGTDVPRRKYIISRITELPF